MKQKNKQKYKKTNPKKKNSTAKQMTLVHSQYLKNALTKSLMWARVVSRGQ